MNDPGQVRPPPVARSLVVGIGASAGGLDAYKAFFANMPSDAGMAFILVQHLDPTHPSMLTEIVQGFTDMPVNLATDGMRVEAGQVYVIPPDAVLTLADRRLHLVRPPTVAARRNTIDVFLSSLAEDVGEDAVGVILSGFGSDGALGVAAIKEWGGLTLSQAEFDHHAKIGMPQSAVSGGFVDHVLQAGDMPAAILAYRRGREIAGNGAGGDLAAHLSTICAVLHSRLNRDFTRYKSGTLMRRIQRRMNILQVAEPARYADLLRSHPHEAELLFRELLIGVTRFFRDPDVFDAVLATVIAPLLDDGRTEPLRVWVAGCATGEEAYSMAILLREALARSGQRRTVQVFGTDLDDRAIETARTGLYPDTIGVDMTPERLEANFVPEDGHFRVRKELRDMCLFSVHDLVSDPPFSRLDLLSCRNLMIYFDGELQQKVLGTFHYALRPGQHLLLGPSESVATQSRLFAPVDKKHRIYRRREATTRLPAFSLSPTPAAGRGQAPARPPGSEPDVERRAAQALARYAPAFLVVNRLQDVLRFSGNTAGLLQPMAGQASLHLFALLHPDLRAPARAAWRQVVEGGGARGRQDEIVLGIEGQRRAVAVIVEPLSPPDQEDGLFVVAFQDQGVRPGIAPAAAGTDADGQAMAAELATTRQRLRIALEELEAANEELRSSNEEYLSVNEELQSANEELETSKEELQSLNEELQTINAELNQRNDSLVRSNSDLINLFDSTSIATLFLDGELRIRRFTPRLLEIFKVRDGDQGRPITDIVTHLSQDGLGRDVREVVRTLQPMEREVAVTERGTSYLMQVRPYRDVNNVIDGAVVTFVDISERKRVEETRSRLAAIVDSSQDAIFSQDRSGIVTSWNEGATGLFGYRVDEIVGRPAALLLPDGMADDMPALLASLEAGHLIERADTHRRAKDGQVVDVSVTMSALRLGGDSGAARVEGVSVIARDIRRRRDAERKAELLMGELHHRVKNVLTIVSIMVSQTLKTSSTAASFAEDLRGRITAMANIHDLLGPTELPALTLRAVIDRELAPFMGRDQAIAVAGPGVALRSQAGMAMAMAIHELATNAAKYGALSVPDGRLDVSWQVAADPAATLTLSWSESGGPPVQPPTRRGFGSTLIERVLAYEAKAEVRREFLDAGVRCTIVMVLLPDIGMMQEEPA